MIITIIAKKSQKYCNSAIFMPLCKLKVKFNLHIKHINIEGKVDYEEKEKS